MLSSCHIHWEGWEGTTVDRVWSEMCMRYLSSLLTCLRLLSAGRANPSVDQDKKLSRCVLYRRDFSSFCSSEVKVYSLLLFVPAVNLSMWSVLFVDALWIQCAFLYGDWIPVPSARLCLRYNSRTPLVLHPCVCDWMCVCVYISVKACQ